MSSSPSPAPVSAPELPDTARLVKATLVAIAVAAVILVTTVLPAEYGIDPTGVGARLGLGALRDGADDDVAAADVVADGIPATNPAAEAAAEAGTAPGPANPAAEAAAAAGPTTRTDPETAIAADGTDIAAANAALADRAKAAFGVDEGQSMDAAAFSASAGEPRTDTFSVTLAPGKGAEVKGAMKAGDGLVFRWTATADVAVDMHGEATGANGTWTSYAVESAQREAAGTFVAAFDGTHGWYWLNRGSEPVTVEIVVTGFQPSLYRP